MMQYPISSYYPGIYTEVAELNGTALLVIEILLCTQLKIGVWGTTDQEKMHKICIK